MSKDLYVRHISAEATEEDLRKLFAVSGKVTYVHMVKDAKSGEFVGCAFVKMSSEAEAKDAIVTLDGALLGNRTILVSEARPQKPKGRQPQGSFPGKGGPHRGKRPSPS
ncbi:MAG: RNA recognition motif domain-containing protein [Desulfuromonadales bacterium]